MNNLSVSISFSDENGDAGDILNMLTLAGLKGGDNAVSFIESFINDCSADLNKSANGKTIIKYCVFLSGLASTDNKEYYLLHADSEMVDLLQDLLPENKPDKQPSISNLIKKLTVDALFEGQKTEKQLLSILDEFPEETKESEEGKNLLRYLMFLLELSRSPDKDEFLMTADEEILVFMQKIMG